MNLREIEETAKALAPVFKSVLKSALETQKKELESLYSSRIDSLRKEFTEKLPVAPDLSEFATKEYTKDIYRQSSVTIEEIREIAREEHAEFKDTVLKTLSEIPLPGKGDPGEDGKSVTIDDVRPLIDEQIKVAVAEIPAPVNGKDGESVTIEDVAPMVQELVGKAIAEIPKPQDGKSVSIDDVLPEIEAGIARKVAEIPVPKNGLDGRDAVDIMILPAIDFSKSYPRGTFAAHNGGLWKSHSQTEGERGWDCIVRGVAEFDVVPKGEREYTAVHTLSDGSKKEVNISLPSMIYRGVWKDGEAYKHGDTVTWGGSLWYANQDTEDKPKDYRDGDHKPWTLAAKKGRDGK